MPTLRDLFNENLSKQDAHPVTEERDFHATDLLSQAEGESNGAVFNTLNSMSDYGLLDAFIGSDEMLRMCKADNLSRDDVSAAREFLDTVEAHDENPAVKIAKKNIDAYLSTAEEA